MKRGEWRRWKIEEYIRRVLRGVKEFSLLNEGYSPENAIPEFPISTRIDSDYAASRCPGFADGTSSRPNLNNGYGIPPPHREVDLTPGAIKRRKPSTRRHRADPEMAEDFREAVLAFKGATGFSRNEIARRMGVNPAHLNVVISSGLSVSDETVEKLIRVVDNYYAEEEEEVEEG